MSYVAICKPLHYTTIMSRELPPACALCMAGRVSDHFFAPYASPPAGLVCSLIILCDYFPLLQLSCSDTWLLEVMGFYFALVSLLFTLALVILSYTYIIRIFWEFHLPVIEKRPSLLVLLTWLSSSSLMEAAYSCMLIPPQRKEIIDKRGSYSHNLCGLLPELLQLHPEKQQVKQAFKDMVYKAVFSANKNFFGQK